MTGLPAIEFCPTCSYPVEAYEGEITNCGRCGEKLIAERISAVSIPTPLVIGVLSFLAGVVLGPSFIASTGRGQAWLQKQARGG